MNRSPALWAVVPAKSFRAAKARMAPLLQPGERDRLARAMLADVLDALTASRSLAGVLVVTADEEVAELALVMGADVLREAVESGTNAAIRAAIEALRERASGMIVIPGDLPHLTPEAVEVIARRCSRPRALVLVAASRDGGTNLLAASPPDLIVPRFGEDSFVRHRAAAYMAGIDPQILGLDRLDLDLDTPEDLSAFHALGTGTRTQSFLAGAMAPPTPRARARADRSVAPRLEPSRR